MDQRLDEKIGVLGLEAEEGLEAEGLLELVLDTEESVRVKGIITSCSEFVVDGVLESDNSWPSCGVGSVG